jgi:signal transduction histidine kinase
LPEHTRRTTSTRRAPQRPDGKTRPAKRVAAKPLAPKPRAAPKPAAKPRAAKPAAAKARRSANAKSALQIFALSPTGLALTRADDGRVLDVNPALCRLLNRRRSELVGKTTAGIGFWTNADDRDFLVRTLRRDGVVRDYELDVAIGGHVPRRFMMSVEPVRHRGMDCLLTSLVDITEARRALAALEQSEESFRTLFGHLPIAVAHCRLVTKGARVTDVEFLRANREWELSFGHRRIAGRRLSELAPNYWAEHPGELERLAEVARTGHSVTYEQPWTTRGRWKRRTVYRPAEGEVVVISEDVTLGRRAAEEARVDRARLDAALNAMDDALFIVDADGRFVELNHAFARFLRFAGREQCPRRLDEYPSFLEAYLADGRLARLDEWVVPRALRGESGSNVEYRLRRKDTGESWYGSFNFAPLHDADGRVTACVATARDVTERRRAEAELARHRHHLEELVRHRTAELEEARTAAEGAARAKATFLANMSHEIRTPLNAVLGMAQLGLRDSGESRTQLAFTRILAAGKLLLNVVNDVLDLSKLDAAKLELETVAFAPAQPIEETVAMLASTAEFKGLALEREVERALPVAVRGDPARIQQVLVNLLSNAIKFTAQGTVAIGLAVEGGSLCYRVRDTGIGIAAADLGRLFDPFEQADGGTARRFGGTGLGLPISRRLAQLMGGELEVASTPGHGSTFTLRLPLVPAAVEANAPVSSPAPVPRAVAGRLAGVRVLAVEDNALNRAVLEDALGGEGAEVVSATDGREAIAAITRGRAAAERPFDVVLMDVQMPEIDGYEATRAIRALDPGVPVIGQSAHRAASEQDAARAAGMAALLTKPLDLEALVELVRTRRRGAPSGA